MSERSRWRSVVATEGDGWFAYQAWVRDLARRSGVYLIRDRETREILYVGHSSWTRDRRKLGLYDTLTRHFQYWDQDWQPDSPKATYDRGAVEVQVILTRADEAADMEEDLIGRHCPPGNVKTPPTCRQDARARARGGPVPF